ncbi:hypothetical protein P9112_013742 [Eukaryota sp. TZLM1-RC]
MVSKKAPSKRLTLRKKYKIERKVKEHHRKIRKNAKNNPSSAQKKSVPLPDSWPIKEQIADEYNRLRDIQKNQQQRRQEEVLKRRQDNQMEEQAKQNELALLVAQSTQRQEEYEQEGEEDQEQYDLGGISEAERQVFLKDLRRVVKCSDVVLQVLDARDPMGCRSPIVEKMVVNSKKKLLLVLNKIDLVPTSAALGWLQYLRQSFPTVAFKSSVQSQRNNLSTHNPLGGDSLLRLLKNYQHNSGFKRTITVGVVGYPNVGKSSLINTLKRSKATVTGNTPGVTRVVQEVMLDKKIVLMDSPGVILATSGHQADLVLRNTVKVEKLTDVVSPVKRILELTPQITLCKVYGIPSFDNVDEFLLNVSMAKGKLKKGGVADIEGAGVIVLRDWNNGKIPYYCPPPESSEADSIVSNDNAESIGFVTEMGKEFNIDDSFINAEQSALREVSFLNEDFFDFKPTRNSLELGQMVEEM